ncbi:hypothetical protein TSUD_94460, partial [Trifolium subterraneum]
MVWQINFFRRQLIMLVELELIVPLFFKMDPVFNPTLSAGTPSTGSPGSTPGTGTGTGTGTTAGSPTVFGISPTSTIGVNGDPSAAGMSYMKGINT